MLMLLLFGMVKGKQLGPLGRSPAVQKGGVPPTTSSKQPKTVPPKQPPPDAGVEPSLSTPADASVSSDDLLKALQLLHSVMSAEHFSKFEKLVKLLTKEEKKNNRELWYPCALQMEGQVLPGQCSWLVLA